MKSFPPVFSVFFPVCSSALFLIGLPSVAQSAVFFSLGQEYQAQAGTNAGTIRTGDPASDPAFSAFLGTAGLVPADVIAGENCATADDGIYATWGRIGTDGQSSLDLGATTTNISIAGWNNATNTLSAPSTGASLDWAYNNGSTLQAGSERPGFASGSGSGFGIFTPGGSASEGIRNAVTFTMLTPVSVFGVFAGDLETGGPNGSPEGFLYVQFSDASTETIFYTPDPTLFPDAVFSSAGNNQSETYGNETGRFIGIADDSRLITSVTFVVGDDDDNEDGTREQLSFIAPMVFTEVSGGTCTNHVPTAVPEPTTSILAAIALGMLALRRRR